jgi:FAD/FMN-containing dehydrogenase
LLGGLSFLSPQYGWASTQVAAYEVVLANGTAVNATETQNTNLRRALQTGGNAFGLVTSFTLKTVPLTDVRRSCAW